MFTKPQGEMAGGGWEGGEASAYPRLCKCNRPREIKTKKGRKKFNNPRVKCLSVIRWREGGDSVQAGHQKVLFSMRQILAETG